MRLMRLQQYEDGTVGYLNYDGDETTNFKTGSSVICTQGENENRDEFISKNNIKLKANMYGSNEEFDIQVNDEDWEVREDVAYNGYGLDKLVNDENDYVRAEVAEHGYGLDKLINDESVYVRAEVAKHGYGLDKLVNDKNWLVRCEVVDHDYGLDILVNDENYVVRYGVAKQGYGLDKLINDYYPGVRDAVYEYLKEHNLTLAEWKKQHGIKDDDATKAVKDFIYKVYDSNKIEVKTEYDSVDEFFAEPVYNDTRLDTLVICTVDTNTPIIKLEKVNKDNKVNYKFVVDIVNDAGEDFIIRTFIKNKDQLNKQIEQTIETLKQYPQFAKYADDLENCL